MIKSIVAKRLAESGYNKQDLAILMGISRPTLNRKIDDPSTLTIGEANKMCEILHLDKVERDILRGG